MKIRSIPFKTLIKLVGSSFSNSEIGIYLLDKWADVKDVDANNKLLKNLILRYAEVEKKMRLLNEELKISQKAMLEDLAAAASIQNTLLPAVLPQSDRIEAAFEFLPCDQVGGDLVNLIRYDDEHWFAWVVDVAGHGPRAAMITVAVAQFLQSLAGADFLQPGAMMKALDKEFPFTRFNSFFTIIFGIVNTVKQTFTYSNSGHPYPILLQPGQPPVFVEGSGPMLGIGIPLPWPEVTINFSGGKSLLLYTDGLVECANSSGQFYGEDQLLEMLHRHQSQSVTGLAASIMAEMRAFMGDVKFQDDFTFLALKSVV